jgi:shikimate kinase
MKNIFLIGMPSSGKSTLGKKLAKALHYHYFDTDRQIIWLEGQPIARIFAGAGEDYFRQTEQRVLQSIKSGQSLVVSTGGGMPCFFDNMAYIKQTGVSVFIDVPPETLAERMMAHAVADRPLFLQHDPELVQKLRLKYENRLSFYRQADIIVSGTNISVQEITKALGAWL